MIRASEILEVPVISYESNSILCNICDILLNKNFSNIKGFLCSGKGVKRNFSILALKDIITKSNEGIIVKDINSVKQIDYIKMENYNSRYQDNIKNKMALNGNGELIGALRDMIFDLTTGYLYAFELSEGYVDDILTGRKIIKAGSGYYFFNNNMVILNKNLVEEQGRGLINLSKI